MYYDANLLFSWFYSIICGRRVTPRFHLFVSDVCQGNEEAKWVQDFFAWIQRWKYSFYIFRELLKNRECALEVGCRGVLRTWMCDICNRRLIYGEMLWLYNKFYDFTQIIKTSHQKQKALHQAFIEFYTKSWKFYTRHKKIHIKHLKLYTKS